MQTTVFIHTNHQGDPRVRLSHTSSYTSLSLLEPSADPDQRTSDVEVFLDAAGALAVAEAAVSAYLALTRKSHTEAFSDITGVWNDRRCAEVIDAIAAEHAANLESIR